MGRPAKHGTKAYKPKPIAYPPELSASVSVGQYRRGPDDITWSCSMVLHDGSKRVLSLGKVAEREVEARAADLYRKAIGGGLTPSRKAEANRPKTFRDAAIIAADRLELDYRATLKEFRGHKGTSKAFRFSAPRSKIVGPLMDGLGDTPWSEIKPAARRWLASYRLANGQKPSQGTIGNINHALQMVCDVAVEQGWLPDDPSARPRLSKKGFAEGTREPSFTHAELMTILHHMTPQSWINEKDSMKRRIMRIMVVLLATAGLRPGVETNDLTEGQITFEDDAILISIRANQGKYKKGRIAVCREGTAINIRSALKNHLNWRRENWTSRLDIDKCSIFANPATGCVPRIDQTFKDMLIECGLLICPEMGKPRVPYSLRHYCISEGVLAGITDQELCLVYGTSPAMIQRHYNHLRTHDIKTKIAGVRKFLTAETKASLGWRYGDPQPYE